ncbi:MAG TPA: contractile injection system tape measure protein, partial [Sunxiuqinia sp.]|nr:contractile injection system tape measure protein [Sunxiuqinia sp.]
KSGKELVQTIHELAESEPEKLKAFVSLVQSNDELFDRFVSYSGKFELPVQLAFGSQNTRSYLNKLIEFAPKIRSKKIDGKFWKSLVLRFTFTIYLKGERLVPTDFVRVFASYLKQRMVVANNAKRLNELVSKLTNSDVPELQEIGAFLNQSATGDTAIIDHNSVEEVAKEPDQRSLIRRTDALFAILIFYSDHGFLPWWAAQSSVRKVIEELGMVSRLAPGLFENAFIRVEKEDAAFQRLVRQLPASVFWELGQVVSRFPSLHSVWQEIKASYDREAKNKEQQPIREITIQDLNKENFKDPELLFKALYFDSDETLLKQWFGKSLEVIKQLSNYLLLTPLIHFRDVQPPQWRRAVYQFAFDYYQDANPMKNDRFARGFLSFLKRNYSTINWEKILVIVYQDTQSSSPRNQAKFPEELSELLSPKQENQADASEIIKKLSDVPTIDEEGVEVHISNSGLILFWPFLTMLFERLSLVENGAFIDRDSQNRAVYILQYLAFGEIDFPEYDLVLNKLLTGRPAEDHLVPFLELTEEEQESVESLLNGLISNWDKVKNSSPQGIQETFVQREGILKFQEDHISLEVEKKGVDVLMGSIPWNISTVKLAWMKKPIHVKWI